MRRNCWLSMKRPTTITHPEALSLKVLKRTPLYLISDRMNVEFHRRTVRAAKSPNQSEHRPLPSTDVDPILANPARCVTNFSRSFDTCLHEKEIFSWWDNSSRGTQQACRRLKFFIKKWDRAEIKFVIESQMGALFDNRIWAQLRLRDYATSSNGTKTTASVSTC